MAIQTFGSLVRDAREAKGLTKKALAAQVGISPQHLGDIEAGTRAAFKPERVVAVSDALALDRDARLQLAASAADERLRGVDLDAALLALVDRYGKDKARTRLEKVIAKREGKAKRPPRKVVVAFDEQIPIEGD